MADAKRSPIAGNRGSFRLPRLLYHLSSMCNRIDVDGNIPGVAIDFLHPSTILIAEQGADSICGSCSTLPAEGKPS